MVCGRCGKRTAPNSTFCPRDQWVLYTDAPDVPMSSSAATVTLDLPRGISGFLERRRIEGQRAHNERLVRTMVEERTAALEERVAADPTDFEAHRTLGALALIEHHWERANAHLNRAHELNPRDFETQVNYGIVLAQRGQLQPALDVFQGARQLWPNTPSILLNLALVALKARRAETAVDAVDALERLWIDNPAIAPDYHDEALTVRGLALLLQNKPAEARATLEAAARHTVAPTSEAASASNTLPAPADAPQMVAPEEAGELASMQTATAALDQDESSDDTIRLVQKSSENGDIPDTETDSEILQLDSKVAKADLLNNLAIAEAAMGSVDRAVARLRAALRIEPGHAYAHNNLGVLAYQQGQLEVAAKYLDIARQIEEFVERPNPATTNNLGVVLSARGDLDAGLQQFQRAGNSDHAEFEVFYNLGRAYIEHGTPDKGVEYLRRAFALDPNQADVHVVLGAAYLLRGKSALLAEALKHLKRALQLNPHHRIAFADLTITMMEMDNEEAARRIVVQALKIHPRSSESLFLLGLLTMEKGDEQHWAQASGYFLNAMETRAELVAGLYNAALSQYLTGFRDAAAKQLQQVTERDPSFSAAYYMIGAGHAVAKRYNEALAAWQQAVQYEPDNSDLQANMAYIYYQRNEWDSAIKCYMHAHRLMPTAADILAALGLCFARASAAAKNDKDRVGMLNRAITAFQQSLALKPLAPITHSNLGLAYYIHKQVEKAVEHWRMVSQLDSGYALRRGEDQQREYDDSIVTLRPLNWRERVVKMAPALPQPQTRLLPGYNAQAFRPAFSDSALQEAYEMQSNIERADRLIAWMHVR